MILVLALDELRPLFFEAGLVHRLLLLAAQAGALLIMIPSLRMLQADGTRTDRQNSVWWRAGFWAVWAAVVILAVALIANLLGRVGLS